MVEQFSSALSQAAWWRCCQVPGHAEAMEWMLIATKLDGVMFCGVWGFFFVIILRHGICCGGVPQVPFLHFSKTLVSLE